MKYIYVFILSTIIFAGCFREPEATPHIWSTHPMYRIMKNAKAEDNSSIELFGAKGEYEPFQLVITAPDIKITDIVISFSDLSGPNGTIKNENIKVWRQHYVKVKKGSPVWEGPPNLPLGKGEYPDGLIPLTQEGIPPGDLPKNFSSVEKGLSHPYWVDVFIPRDTEAGEYRGIGTVKTAQGSSDIEVILTVWNFELPRRPSLRSMFGIWGKYSNGTELLLEHRLMPFGDLEPKGNYYAQREKIKYYDEKYGINTIEAGRWSGAYWGNFQMSSAPSRKDWKELEESFPEEFQSMLCNFTADEVWDQEHLKDTLREWGKNMHLGSSIKNLVTMPPITDLYDDGNGNPVVDIWSVLPLHAEDTTYKKNIQDVLAMGSEVWFYTALLQDSYSPKWLMDFPPINYRAPAWINHIYGFTGILYWRVDYWSEDPWSSFDRNSDYPPGEGMLVYPGEPLGLKNTVLPSMRLKYLRESVEDYEYIEILKSLGQEEFAMDTVHGFARSWKDWSHNGELLMEKRMILGEKINLINSP